MTFPFLCHKGVGQGKRKVWGKGGGRCGVREEEGVGKGGGRCGVREEEGVG